MRRIALLLALPLLALATLRSPVAAQAPRQVRIALDERVTIRTLLEAGLDIVEVRGQRHAEILEWPGDAATLERLGARTELVDADPGRTAAVRSRAGSAARPATSPHRVRSATRPDGVFRSEALPAFGFGSLAGYWTLAEVKMKLDELVANDTHDVVAAKLDTLGWSLQHRPIWGLKLGTPVAGPDPRPLAFYNSLTHCREPGGMQALFYFVDDLLGKYPGDPVARQLLQKRQIYIVPVVNPDGYFFNQRIYDSTGTFGLWRKNLRDNNTSGTTNTGDGVDINRNFGVRWGHNNIGSSNSTSSEIYRGPGAYSEPETQVQRDAIIALRPVTGLSFHTFSDLLIHPWGWTTTPTPDSARFQTWSDEMSRDNGFTAGPGPRILYEVNGEFNDFTYGDTLSKPVAFTWTPELGGPDDGFWPAPSRITPIAQSILKGCYVVAGVAGPWLRVERSSITDGTLNAGGTAHLAIRARNLGATGQAGPLLKATLAPLDHEVDVLSGPVSYPTLGSFQSADASGGATFWISAVDTITPGRMVRFRVDFTDASGLFCRDTVEVIVGTPTVVASYSFNTIAGWLYQGGTWGIRTNDPDHPSAYLNDSPSGPYPSGNLGIVRQGSAMNLSAGTRAWVQFEDRWAFESDYDAGTIEVSRNGTAWTRLAGNGSTPSDPASVIGGGIPSFEGTRWRWAQDRVDLAGFAGGAANSAVYLRFTSNSDAGAQLDGLNVDSVRVLLYDPALQPAPVAAVGPGGPVARLVLAAPSPNPARDLVRFDFAVARPGELALDILDVQGRVVFTRREHITAGSDGAPFASRFQWGWDVRDNAGRHVAPGLYLVRLRSAAQEAVQRVVVLP